MDVVPDITVKGVQVRLSQWKVHSRVGSPRTVRCWFAVGVVTRPVVAFTLPSTINSQSPSGTPENEEFYRFTCFDLISRT